MTILSSGQIGEFEAIGYTVAPNAVTDAKLAALRDQYAGWLDESRQHGRGYGSTVDNKPRFDLDSTHSAADPALWRVNNPVEVSSSYYDVMADSAMTDMVTDLIGPDVKFHHSKINTKPPRSDADVKFHQDFTGTPHSNTDVVTAMLFLDDMTPENGCMKLVAGSHREGIHSVWDGDRFTAMAAPEVEADCEARAERILGPAGSVCLMSTLTLHGSEPNRSDRPRGLFICVYAAADAVPLCESIVKSRLEGMIVRGKPSRWARLEALAVELLEIYPDASFREVQERAVRAP